MTATDYMVILNAMRICASAVRADRIVRLLSAKGVVESLAGTTIGFVCIERDQFLSGRHLVAHQVIDVFERRAT